MIPHRAQDWLNLFFTSPCGLCGRSAPRELCPYCQQQVASCQLANPQHSWRASLPLFAWGAYRGALKRVIAALKYDNQPQLARPLGQWLAEAWLASRLSPLQLTVVPIPLHPDKHKVRGYNQAALLAQRFCDVTRLPLRCRGLERSQPTEAQFGLSIVEREQNLAQAFCLGKDFLQRSPAQPVLLLDDIYTTGATARAALKTLRRSRIQVQGIVTLAFAEQLRSEHKGSDPV